MNLDNNHTLINQLKKGNKKAFSFLIDTYHHKLCVYANSLIKNNIQTEDVVQNVYLYLWEKREKLNANYSIQSFLYKAVYNEFIDHYRKTQAVLRIEKVYIQHLDSLLTDSNKEETEELIANVKELIKKLPPKCRRVFELSKKEGLTNIEISEYLGISIKAVEAQITKAFKFIRIGVVDKIKIMLFLLFGTIKKFKR